MYRLDSNKVRVSFQDVAAGFSGEEWELLHKWQKSLYEAVMRDIYQVLDSLGPAIATSVFSLRAKEKEDLYPVDNPDSERRCSKNHSPGQKTTTEVTSSASIKDERRALPSYPETQSSSCPTGLPLRRSAPAVRFMGHSDGGGEGSCSVHSGLTTFNSGDFSRMEEEQRTIFMDTVGAEAPRRKADAGSVNSFLVKQEDDANSRDLQLSEGAEDHSRHACDGSITTEIQVRCLATSAEKTAEFKALCGQEGTMGPESSSYGWTEINPGFEVEKTSQHEWGSTHQVHKGLPKNRASNIHSAQRSDINTENQSKTQKYWKTHKRYETEKAFAVKRPVGHECTHTAKYSGTDCEKCFRWKASLVEQKTAPVTERPYQCTECEKTFKHKENFIEHQRTHTGQRPYQCTDCGKSFIRKRTLIAHQRIHTGERPYQCTGCWKSFSLKHNLNTHQKTCRHLL